MFLRTCCRDICSSKAAKALFWLTICIIIILIIVVSVEIVEKAQEDAERNEKFEISPRPRPSIHYKFKKPKNYNRMINKISDFLKEYNAWQTNTVDCSFNSSYREPGHSCKVDLTTFGPCVKDQEFGYPKATPCVFIKFNKVPNWVPEPYDLGELNKTHLSSKYIDFVEQEVIKSGEKVLKMIWAECEGKTPYDSTLLGPVDYYPLRGYPAYYFPYQKDALNKYMEPLMAIQLKHARTDTLIDIVCHFYARNFHEKLSFSVLIDDSEP